MSQFVLQTEIDFLFCCTGCALFVESKCCTGQDLRTLRWRDKISGFQRVLFGRKLKTSFGCVTFQMLTFSLILLHFSGPNTEPTLLLRMTLNRRK